MIVPAMLLASLAVLALAGSFGGLAALGQALSGLSVPAPALAGGRGGPAATAVPPALAAALTARATPAGRRPNQDREPAAAERRSGQGSAR